MGGLTPGVDDGRRATERPELAAQSAAKEARHATGQPLQRMPTILQIVIVRDHVAHGLRCPLSAHLNADKPMQATAYAKAMRPRQTASSRDKPGGLVWLSRHSPSGPATYTEARPKATTFDTAGRIAVMLEKHGNPPRILHANGFFDWSAWTSGTAHRGACKPFPPRPRSTSLFRRTASNRWCGVAELSTRPLRLLLRQRRKAARDPRRREFSFQGVARPCPLQANQPLHQQIT